MGNKRSKKSIPKKKACINKSAKRRVEKKILSNKLKVQRRAEAGTLEVVVPTPDGAEKRAKRRKLSLHEQFLIHQAQKRKEANAAGIVLDTTGSTAPGTSQDSAVSNADDTRMGNEGEGEGEVDDDENEEEQHSTGTEEEEEECEEDDDDEECPQLVAGASAS